MTMDDEFVKLWRKISPNQRLVLICDHAPRDRQVRVSQFIVASRVLDRLGLSAGRGKSPKGAALAEWAIREGHARWTGETWQFADLPRRAGKIDRGRLCALAADGHHAAAIGRELGVTRESVRQAAQRWGVEVPPAPPRVARLEFHVSPGERAAVENAAATEGLTVAAYLRARCVPKTPIT